MTIKDLNITQSEKEKLNPLFWAERNVRMRVDGKWTNYSISNPPRLYPFLRDIFYDRGVGGVRHQVVEKPRQCGLSIAGIVMALYAVDVWGFNTTYALPDQQKVNDFSSARVGEIIRNSPNVRRMFEEIDNVRVKVGKSASLYFKGMNSPAGLEEVPSSFIIRDELDYMIESHAKMILESLSGSFHKWILDIGHPTYPGRGIDEQYQDSSQHEWKFYCPHCEEKQPVTWDNNVDVDNCRLICAACGKTLQKEDLWKGFYEAKYPDHYKRGYHFNQLLSPTVELYEQIIKWNQAVGVPYKMKIFYNTVLGLPYAEASRKLSEEDIRRLMTGPSMSSAAHESVMGLDVGGGLHLWIEADNRLISVAMLYDWDELESYVQRYNPKCVVIDAGPELHKGSEVCKNLRSRGIDAWLCMRSDGLKGNRVIDENTITIKVNKTEQFDEFYGKLMGMELPNDLPEDAISHLTAPVRVIKEKPNGMKEGAWEKGISHYADAGSYSMEAAKQVALKKRIPTNIIVPEIKRESTWRGRLSDDFANIKKPRLP